jgi:hypothetical protein
VSLRRGTATSTSTTSGATSQRKVVTPNDFTNLDQIRTRLAEFEIRYNAVAGPYNWRFTRTDLDALLDRLASNEQARHDLAA